MKISEACAGDVVVVLLDRRETFVQVTSLLKTKHTNPKKRVVHTVLVTAIDPETGLPDPAAHRTWFSVHVDVEVVAVVDTMERRRRISRELCLPRWRWRYESGTEMAGEVDPLRRNQDKAERDGADQEDIPF